MLDQEARHSISDPFFVEMPMAVSTLRIGPGPPQQPEGKMWYCHVNGSLSDKPPERAVGGINATEMGMGKTVEMLGLFSATLGAARAWQRAQPAQRPAGTRRRGGTLICMPVTLFGQCTSPNLEMFSSFLLLLHCLQWWVLRASSL